MDITIKVKDRFGKMQSCSFIGDKKEDVIQGMQEYIDKNRDKYIQIRKTNLHKMEPIPICKIPN